MLIRQAQASSVEQARRAHSDSSTRPWGPTKLLSLQSLLTMTLNLSLVREVKEQDQVASASRMPSEMATT